MRLNQTECIYELNVNNKTFTHNLNIDNKLTMARITTFVKGIRNHWKKSLFGVGAVSYGISYANEKYK